MSITHLRELERSLERMRDRLDELERRVRHMEARPAPSPVRRVHPQYVLDEQERERDAERRRLVIRTEEGNRWRRGY